ncbi:hypothetical protein E2P81_ATG08166 [Venturia nashicola]|nr:hypothetical protein E2P81_ATG08166 [Venturia nashicola]
MAIFSRRKSTKKPSVEEEKKSQRVSPAVKKPPQSKHVHVPQHAAADSQNVRTPSAKPARPDMHELVRREMTAPGSDKFMAPKLKANRSWSAGDLTIASMMGQPLEKGPARHSSRHSSFNSGHRRQAYRSNTSLARSPLSNTIVEEDLSETTDESPAGSASSSDDGLEMKHSQPRSGASPMKASSTKSMPELVSEPPTDTLTTLRPNPPIKDKVDSFVGMPTGKTATAAVPPSAQEHVEKSSPASKELPTTLSPSFDLDLGLPPKSPTIDLLIESPKDDWFAENSRSSEAFQTGVLDDPKVQQWKAEEESKADPMPKPPTELSRDQNQTAETSPMPESCASSLAPESQADVAIDKSSLLESSASSIDLRTLSRSPRQSGISVSAPTSRSSSLVRSEHHEYIVRQANAYNTVLGHLYPGGRSVASPPDSMRHLHQSQRLSSQPEPQEGRRQSNSISSESARSQWISPPMQEADASSARVDMVMNRGRQLLEPERSQSSQRRVSSSPYRGSSDGIVHVSRYPSSRRASSISGSSPSLSELTHEESYFQPQQDTQPMQPPPIPMASKPRFVPTYVQPNHNPRPSMQRHNTTDVYSHTIQTPDLSYINYSKQISYTRRESFDSYSRGPDTRRSSAIDDRIAIAHMDSSYRQSRTDLCPNENADYNSHTSLRNSRSHISLPARSHTSLADQRSISSSKHYASSISESTSDSNIGRAYSMSSASYRRSGEGNANTDSDMSSLFSPSINNDPQGKPAQVLGGENKAGGSKCPPAPLKERPLLVTEFLMSDTPMVTRLEYPPSPTRVPGSEASSVGEKGKKFLDMPRGTPKRKPSSSFLGKLRRKKSVLGAY